MASRTVIAEAPPPPATVRRRSGAARRISGGLGPLVLCVVAASAWVLAVTRADFSRMGNLGLASILGWPYLVAVLALAVALTWEIWRGPRTLVMTALVIAMVVVLFGTASAVEPIARISVAWLHAGFIDYIATHGAVLHHFDARFDWPGFFSLAAVVDAVTGRSDATWFLRWAPLFFELSYLAPIRVLARSCGIGERAGWIGVVLFFATDWIEQDYFSPQALNLLLFLVIIACLFAFWRPGERRGSRAAPSRRTTRRRRMIGFLREALRPRPPAQGLLRPDRQIGLTALLVVVMCAMVASHQLTPFGLILALCALYLTRRLPGPELPILLLLLTMTWLSVAGADFWVGHLSAVFGGLGRLRSAVSSNLGSRVTGSVSHRLIADLRIGISATLMLLAALGVRRPKADRSLELLALCPFLLVAVQSYGGEALLRAFLYSLPFAAMLAGAALAPLVPRRAAGSRRARRWRPVRVAVGAAALGAVFAGFISWTTFVRGGNDPFVAFTSDERAAVLTVYAAARPGQSVAPLGGYLPIGDRGIGSLRYVLVDPDGTETLSQAETSLVNARPDWIVFGISEQRWGELVSGWPPSWQTELQHRLLASGYTVYRAFPTATVLVRTGAAG